MSSKPPHGRPQIRVALGTVEVTDTDRRAIAWEYDGDRIDGEWVLNVERTRGKLASRDEARFYLRKHGEYGLAKIVRDYLNAGGQTASMEASAQ